MPKPSGEKALATMSASNFFVRVAAPGSGKSVQIFRVPSGNRTGHGPVCTICKAFGKAVGAKRVFNAA